MQGNNIVFLGRDGVVIWKGIKSGYYGRSPTTIGRRWTT